MSTGPDEFLATLGRRKFWRSLDPTLLAAIVRNADGDMELLRNFVFISENYGLVENNFLSFANDPEPVFGSPALGCALTLCSLGSDLCKQCVSVKDAEQLKLLLGNADIAFNSSVLCDPLHLEPYFDMACLYSELMFNKQVALEWCAKYKIAEQRLLDTPDEKLNTFHVAAKRLIQDPNAAMQAEKEIAAHAPDLLKGLPLGEEKTMSEIIEDLERRLLSS